MKEKLLRHINYFSFERDFLSENRVTWNDISYRKIDSKSKKKDYE